MKKIAVIPLLYDELNYGGVLQFYALQRVLMQEGYEVRILQVNDETFVVPRNRAKQISIKGRIAQILFYPKRLWNRHVLQEELKDRKKKVDLFKKKHYAPVVNLRQENLSSYDAFICGSDQIWNPLYARKRHFLSFAPDASNRIIYAASLGTESVTKEQEDYMKPYIDKIQHISTREYSGKKILDSFCERSDIEVVLDPTLLLTREEWTAILPARRKKEKPYVFSYFLGNVSDTMKKCIFEYAQKNELQVINVSFASGERYDDDLFGEINLKDLGPEEFLSYIQNAHTVFTDSFHASVFSLLFNTVFYVFERNTSTKMIGRIHTLQQNFHIGSRIITDTHSIDEIDNMIDFDKIVEYQNTLREKSMDFLIGSIEQ